MKQFQSSGGFGNYGVLVFVCGGAAAEQAQDVGAGVPDFVRRAGRDGDRVAGFYVAQFGVDAHATGAVGDVVDFFGDAVVMLLRACAGSEAGFGEALVADDGVAMREQFADFGAVLGNEGRDSFKILDIHCFFRDS